MTQLSREGFTATRATQVSPDPEQIIDIPCADAFSIIVQLEDFAAHRLWRGRRLSYSGGYQQGNVSLPFMGDELRCQHRSAYDNLRLNIPRQTLDQLQVELGSKKIDMFHYEQGGNQDPVLYHLAQAMLPALQRPDRVSQLFIDHLLLAMCSHALQRYGRLRPASGKLPASLTPIQLRLAKELIASQLGNDLSVQRIAQECSLSRSHFSRAFKQATGVAPHTWLLQMRVERARVLLLQRPAIPMVQIAQDCGFADQPHLTRVFTRLTGEPPSAWRNRHQPPTLLPS
ncbi:MAG TPA: AraC family transcriptional regulator [Pseudomonas sp.]|uniref:AraC family transcriptional regulator n=1 Tax=Pseudomonas sp. TaxID=306 RepID=UPI002EDB9886